MVIIEIQHSYNGSTACITTTYTDKALAEQKYHQVLSAAAVSTVGVHSCVMLEDDGSYVKEEPYYHTNTEN